MFKLYREGFRKAVKEHEEEWRSFKWYEKAGVYIFGPAAYAYGLVSGLMMKFVRTRYTTADLYISIITAMLCGRVVAGLAKAWIFTPGTPPFAWVTTSLVTGIPGIVLQLVLMPLVIFALTKAKLLPARYPKEELAQ